MRFLASCSFEISATALRGLIAHIQNTVGVTIESELTGSENPHRFRSVNCLISWSERGRLAGSVSGFDGTALEHVTGSAIRAQGFTAFFHR